MKSQYRPFSLLILFVLLLAASCGAAPAGSTAQPAATAAPTNIPATIAPTVTRTPQPTDTPKPTLTPVPTKTATPEPTQRPTEPVILAVISGTGAVVSDNYELPKCGKAVFNWTAFPGGYGTASLILKLYNVATPEKSVTLVADMQSDTPDTGFSGMTLQPLKGGTYYLTTENTDAPWTVRVECQDGLAPVATGSMEVEGTGDTVTGFYELPACNKSVFNWSTAPSTWGTASIIIYLCKEGVSDCESLAADMKSDLTADFTGQAAARLSGGLYYLYVYNLSGPTWSVRWECKD